MKPDTVKGEMNFNELRKDTRQTDLTIALDGLFDYGFLVFEDHQKFLNWMKAKCHALGGVTPTELTTTVDGIAVVKDMLGRIAHGIHS